MINKIEKDKSTRVEGWEKSEVLLDSKGMGDYEDFKETMI